MSIDLGNKPSKREPNAQARTRTREEAPEGGASFRWASALAPSLFTGALTGSSLYHAEPMSLASWRKLHERSAAHFQAGALRWPRQCYGGLHLLIAGALYLMVWVTGSLPRMAVAVIVVGLGFWLHVL